MNTTIEALIERWLRYRLRIAVTVLCLAACGLFTWLWISSYYSPLRIFNIQSWKGMLEINPGLARVGSAWQDFAVFRIPHWPVVLLFAGLAALPWVQWSRRYSLRAFLVMVTLLALLLGALVISN
jgi:hypothetical protein